MKQGSTLFLRGVVILIGLLVLALCLFVLPIGIRESASGMYRPLLLGMYVPAIPFFLALYQGWKLLGHIDADKAFSDHSVRSLNLVKYYALSIGIMYTLGLPYIYVVADMDDAPGVIVLGLVVVFASLVVSVFAALLQRLLGDALAIKSENDLTV
jgi:hypothetical protein